MRITGLVAIPLLLVLTACGSSPAAPSPRCRRYPLHYTEINTYEGLRLLTRVRTGGNA